MLDFMDHVQNAFYTSTNWNVDNGYTRLNSSAQSILDFRTPRGLRFHLSSLSTPNFATSYSLGSISVIDGSLSYLYSTLPLSSPKSADVDLRLLSPGYHQHHPWKYPSPTRDDALMYGRMFLPSGTLEALYLRRIGASKQVRVTAVSDSKLKHGGTILAMLQQDTGKWSSEYLYSTDVALLGWRGLWNFGEADPRPEGDKPVGRFSGGAEVYYGVLNKSAGMSTGLRYTTLPQHPGIPLTMTLTLNPLMGHWTATYAVKVGEKAAFASRFEFNMFSYESDIVMGAELWRSKGEEGMEGVLKAKMTQNGSLGLLWEGRLKELLFSIGGAVDFRRGEGMVKVLGVEIAYSS
ncbi:mitochondrial distribution and morphology protein 10 [Pyronema omphalodes]|nr:mitochondrial distribution and morphology protein 10 [Pyronema omphalodes]